MNEKQIVHEQPYHILVEGSNNVMLCGKSWQEAGHAFELNFAKQTYRRNADVMCEECKTLLRREDRA